MLREHVPPTASERKSAFPPHDLVPAARVFGRLQEEDEGEEELSLHSEPLVPADRASMDEDTLEAKARWLGTLWWPMAFRSPMVFRSAIILLCCPYKNLFHDKIPI